MSTPHRTIHCRGFTRIDLIIALATLGVLSSVLLPCLALQRSAGDRITCVNNLRRIGSAFLQFAEENQPNFRSEFPFRTPLAQGGTLGRTTLPEHVTILSNYLGTTTVLICPSSWESPASSFAQLRSPSISYALATHASPLDSTRILMTDQDIVGGFSGTCASAGKIAVQAFAGTVGNPNSFEASWSATNHVGTGQVLLSDGAVLPTDSSQLRAVFAIQRSFESAAMHFLSRK